MAINKEKFVNSLFPDTTEDIEPQDEQEVYEREYDEYIKEDSMNEADQERVDQQVAQKDPNSVEPWDYNGEQFTRCKKCNKAMPVKFKGNHHCETTQEKPFVKPDTQSQQSFKTGDQVKSGLKEAFDQSVGDVINVLENRGVLDKFSGEDIRTMINTYFIQRCRG